MLSEKTCAKSRASGLTENGTEICEKIRLHTDQ